MASDEQLLQAKSDWEAEYNRSVGPTHGQTGHVIGVGIGPQLTEKDEPLGPNCLRFFVEKKIDTKEAIKKDHLRIEKYYKGFPTDVIETGRLVSFQVQPADLKAVPGTTIGLDPRDLPSNLNPALAGTLGAVVSMGGKHYILGSNHAMAVNGRAIGMQVVFRPPIGFIADPDDSIFARITEHVHLKPGLNEVDCALAELEEYRAQGLDRVRADFPKHLVMAEDGIEPTVNMKVARVDDSEEATGTIISISAHPRFDFSFGSFDFKDLVLIEGDDNEENRPFARPGDSGALVVGFDGEKYRPTAIVIGGARRKWKTNRWKSYTLACSFNTAIEKLGAKFPKSPQGFASSSPKILLTMPPPKKKQTITITDRSSLRNKRLSTRAEGAERVEVAKADGD